MSPTSSHQARPQLVCLGELLIDMMAAEAGFALHEVDLFKALPGGAPANVCAAAAKLGITSSLIAAVGDDPFGRKLVAYVDTLQVDTTHIVAKPQAFTTMAFVSRDQRGERDFIFSRGADALLSVEDVNPEVVKGARVVHFGSATGLLPGAFHDTYWFCAQLARESGVTTSFDPNFRDALWGQPEAFVKECLAMLPMMDLVKVSDEEAQLLTGLSDVEAAAMALLEQGPKVVCVTLGAQGTLLVTREWGAHVVGSITVDVVDTTGAGDAFVGGLLAQCCVGDGLQGLLADRDKMIEAVRRANVVGALVCGAEGAMANLPGIREVDQALR